DAGQERTGPMTATWKAARVPASLVAVLGALMVALAGAPQASAATCQVGHYWMPERTATVFYGTPYGGYWMNVAATSTLNAQAYSDGACGSARNSYSV